MSPRTPKQYEQMRTEKREIILDAALHIFAEHGYHTATVSKIALAAGVSKGLLYNYFASKEEVLKTLVFEMVDKMLARFQLPDGIPHDDLISDYIDISLDIILEDIQYAKLFFSLYVQPEVMALVTEKIMEQAVPFMEIMTNYFKNKGESDPVSTMRLFSATLDGVQLHLIMDPEFPVQPVKELIKKHFIYS